MKGLDIIFHVGLQVVDREAEVMEDGGLAGPRAGAGGPIGRRTVDRAARIFPGTACIGARTSRS